MKHCTLIRLDYKTGLGTFGVLLVEGKLLCYTLEKPFLYNIRNESCIPCGIYLCSYVTGAKEGYLLQDVPNRSGIMIHAGNTLSDTSGCILLGKSLNACISSRTEQRTRKELERSREAVNLFEGILDRQDFELSIEEYLA